MDGGGGDLCFFLFVDVVWLFLVSGREELERIVKMVFVFDDTGDFERGIGN